jgi:hypothetical protein
VGHNSCVGVGILVVSGVAEPVDELWDDKGDVLSIEFEVRVVTDVGTVINERIVNKVPFLLPLATLHSDIISKSSALNERIVTFLDGQFFAIVLESSELFVDVGQGSGVLSLKLVISNTGNDEMTLSFPALSEAN